MPSTPPTVPKSRRSEVFRERLRSAMLEHKLNRTSLAGITGVDRSTVSQLLSEHQVRLPSGHVVAELASALGVSADWLLGLSNSTLGPGEILRESLQVATALPDRADVHIERWLQEATGSKVRNVPTNLPEVMKTRATLQLEYAKYEGKTPQQALQSKETRLSMNRLVGTDYEFAMPVQTLTDFAQRSGIWAALKPAQVREQLLHMAELCDELYPSTRLHLYDLKQRYSAPVTVFGQQRAVIYIGSSYLVFNTREHIETLTRHFDDLVRDASVLSHAVSAWLTKLAAGVKL
ncbi:helix-turn-helix domain-containing protein [Rhodoferax lacus]|nr:helix-turn-helix domain-containing protein [Rhodoferax lacus]